MAVLIPVVPPVAVAVSELAKRAQPQTVASRLTLRDFHDVVAGLAVAAHALGDGIEDRWALVMEPRLRSVTRQTGARVRFAAGHLDDAVQAVSRDLVYLHRRSGESLDGRVSGGRRPLAWASGRFAGACQALRDGCGELGAAQVESLRGICAQFGSAVNHVALLTDAATERALGRPSAALTPMINARRELDHARRRADVLCAVFF